jgi:hypothetical protein
MGKLKSARASRVLPRRAQSGYHSHLSQLAFLQSRWHRADRISGIQKAFTARSTYRSAIVKGRTALGILVDCLCDECGEAECGKAECGKAE